MWLHSQHRMKKLFTLLLFVTFSGVSHSQTYIKTNALYWAALMPNLQVETSLGGNFTFQGEVNASLWEGVTDKNVPLMGVQFIAGSRYYFEEKFTGFYVGGDVGFDIYNMSRPDYWGETAIGIQHGIGYYLGVTAGYQLAIGERWNIDFFVGGGWHLGLYWGERRYNDGSTEVYTPWNRSGEWIPYKVGVTFAFRL